MKKITNKKTREKYFYLLLFGFGLVASLIALGSISFSNYHLKQAAQIINKQVSPPEEAIPSNNPDQIKTTDYSIPILMYHYIRVVEDQNDKLGINLSVTPEKFARQLDYLQEKGYQTINFKDVLDGKIPSKPVILTFDDGYEDFFTTAYPELQKHNMTAVSFIITGKSDINYMTKEQIKTLANASIEIGSHTISHPDLSILSEDKVNNEIMTSKKELEDMTGQKVISLCYPAGKYIDKTVDLTKNAGYIFAVTTKSGIGEFKDPFRLHRYRMNADTEISAYLK